MVHVDIKIQVFVKGGQKLIGGQKHDICMPKKSESETRIDDI